MDSESGGTRSTGIGDAIVLVIGGSDHDED
jgi:hypothetical protein